VLSPSPEQTKISPCVSNGWIPADSAKIAANFRNIVAVGSENEVPKIAPVATEMPINLAVKLYRMGIYHMRHRSTRVIFRPDVSPFCNKIDKCLRLSFETVDAPCTPQTNMQTALALGV
jgi:hypothetical protein